MSKPITLQIRPRGKPIKSLPEAVSVPADATAADLYGLLSTKSRYSVHQLRVTKGSDGSHIPNGTSTVHSTGLRNDSTIYVKDLGPQIAWRTVFVIEYLAPIFIHPLFYALAAHIYGGTGAQSQMQKTALVAIVAHFVKREFETLFIHRFSAATMPIRNIFKNSAHYWLLSGVNMAYWIYSPTSSSAKDPPNQALLFAGIALYAFGELGNLSTHLTLRNLRSQGGNERGIPQGALFNLVTCPNYFTEVLSWVGVWLISGLNWSVVVFLVASGAQMASWASKKERRYRKEFGDKYKRKRFVMLPGIW
ncbi:putative enoyl [Cyphellophora attinorum]|uniref:very-long-chain enoyl-CoA reductase n=1 Tax=Cyphellophora attinorum TaxID=1664694 RepID=A0A0N0NQ38_9EURO|nr:putative enoyl [Phialophora attinorum]KPI43458.1 putative enoyl [Phialophora attinorum]